MTAEKSEKKGGMQPTQGAATQGATTRDLGVAKNANTVKDLVLVHGKSEDGKSYQILRNRKGKLEAGVMQAVEQGKPLQGELVKLTPRKESTALFDAETIYESEKPAEATERPAVVATPAYRSGWDSIWGAKSRKRRTSSKQYLN